MEKRVTIKDIAADVGVSISIVSYVLNDSKKVSISKETRKKVLESAQRLGYIRNKNAAILRRGKSNTIGIVSYWDDNFVYSSFINGIKAYAKEAGYKILIYSADTESDINDFIGYYRDRMIDGIVILSPYDMKTEFNLRRCISLLDKNNVKFSVIGEYIDGIENLVAIDYFKSAFVATEYFLLKGIRDITFVSPPTDIKETKERYEGYCAAMAKYNAKPVFYPISDIKNKLNSLKAVVANKSQTAYEIFSAALEQGYKIPDDFEVVSCNTEYYSKYLYPSLSSVLIPATEMGKAAAKNVIYQIDNKKSESINAFEYKLAPGNSTKN